MKNLFPLLLAALIWIGGCGDLETRHYDFQPGNTPSPSSSEDGSTGQTQSAMAVVHVTDFFSSALVSVVQNLAAVTADDILINVLDPLPHTDAVLRSYNGLVYVVNRLGRDSIQVVDPAAGFDTIFEFSVGPGTNPQDILVAADDLAYITRLQPEAIAGGEELLIVNPQNGAVRKTVDITFLTDADGDRNARAVRMTQVGEEVWILLQDLSIDFAADTNGKIAVIDTLTNTLVDTDPSKEGIQGIQLTGRNPSDLAYHEASGQVLVSMTGVFQPDFTTDTSDDFGGIEAVDVSTYLSKGIVIDDADLGGHPRGIQIASENQAFTIVSDTQVISFDPTGLEVVNRDVYQSPGFFLPDILFDGNQHLLITERGDFAGQGAGLVILDLANDFAMQGPLDVGGPPSAVTIVMGGPYGSEGGYSHYDK